MDTVYAVVNLTDFDFDLIKGRVDEGARLSQSSGIEKIARPPLRRQRWCSCSSGLV